jgi:hypothetical protein
MAFDINEYLSRGAPQPEPEDPMFYVRKPEAPAEVPAEPSATPAEAPVVEAMEPSIPQAALPADPLRLPREVTEGPPQADGELPSAPIVTGDAPSPDSNVDLLSMLGKRTKQAEEEKKKFLEDYLKAKAEDDVKQGYHESASPYTGLMLQRFTGVKPEFVKPTSQTEALVKKQNAMTAMDAANREPEGAFVAAEALKEKQRSKKDQEDPDSPESEYARNLVEKMAPGVSTLPSGKKLSASQIYATFPKLEAYAASENRVKQIVEEAGRKRADTKEIKATEIASREKIAGNKLAGQERIAAANQQAAEKRAGAALQFKVDAQTTRSTERLAKTLEPVVELKTVMDQADQSYSDIKKLPPEMQQYVWGLGSVFRDAWKPVRDNQGRIVDYYFDANSEAGAKYVKELQKNPQEVQDAIVSFNQARARTAQLYLLKVSGKAVTEQEFQRVMNSLGMRSGATETEYKQGMKTMKKTTGAAVRNAYSPYSNNPGVLQLYQYGGNSVKPSDFGEEDPKPSPTYQKAAAPTEPPAAGKSWYRITKGPKKGQLVQASSGIVKDGYEEVK